MKEQKKKKDKKKKMKKYPVSNISIPPGAIFFEEIQEMEQRIQDGMLCDNQWKFAEIAAVGSTRAEVIQRIRRAARASAAQQKQVMNCGNKTCAYDSADCVFKAQFAMRSIVKVMYEDLEKPADPITWIEEWQAAGVVRVGCFCEHAA